MNWVDSIYKIYKFNNNNRYLNNKQISKIIFLGYNKIKEENKSKEILRKIDFN
jgi:hypothetical protein